MTPASSVPAKPRETTVLSVVFGMALAVVFGAANAYLGLKVGMTVSASIPAAVISLGVMRFVFRRRGVLESNLVQTIGSAGESIAAGAVFTLPAVFLWHRGRSSRPVLSPERVLRALCSRVLRSGVCPRRASSSIPRSAHLSRLWPSTARSVGLGLGVPSAYLL